jgi:hypothetical protein
LTISCDLHSDTEKKPSIDLLFLTSKEGEQYHDADIRLYFRDPDVDFGHSKTFLYCKDFPINTKMTFSTKRPLEKRASYKENYKFFVREQGFMILPIDPKNTHRFFCISSRGFLPGERVLCRFSGKNLKIDTSFFPNPIKVFTSTKTAFIEAELLTIVPAFYRFFFTGFQENEILNFISISGEEKIEKTFTLTPKNFIVSSPDIIGKLGGVGTVTFTRKSGEKIQLHLPWGIDFIDYRKGEKIY